MYDRNFAISPLKKVGDAKAVEKKENKKARESNIDGNDISQSELHKEDLKYEFIKIAARNYK